MITPMFSESVHGMMVDDSNLVDFLIDTDDGIDGLALEIRELAARNGCTLSDTQLAYQVTCVYRNLCYKLGVEEFLKYCANVAANGLESLSDMTAIVENVSGYYSGISCELGFYRRWESIILEWDIVS